MSEVISVNSSDVVDLIVDQLEEKKPIKESFLPLSHEGGLSKPLMRRVNHEILLQNNIFSFLTDSFVKTKVEKPKKLYVGEMQERWQFPSDHLPIGAQLDDFCIVSWNVLNPVYMDWVTEYNSQGLSRSSLARDHFPINEEGLTKREQKVIERVVDTFAHPTHPKSIVCLQECGRVFISELKKVLPAHLKVLTTNENPSIDDNVLIYDSNLFAYSEKDSQKKITGIFQNQPERPVQEVILVNKKTQKRYQIFNLHMPGDPNLPSRQEFADFMAQNLRVGLVTIILGDMNFDEVQMKEAFEKAFAKIRKDNPFDMFAPYFTDIGPDFKAKIIDHIFFHGVEKTKALFPNEVMQDLQKTLDALHQRGEELKGRMQQNMAQ